MCHVPQANIPRVSARIMADDEVALNSARNNRQPIHKQKLLRRRNQLLLPSRAASQVRGRAIRRHKPTEPDPLADFADIQFPALRP